MPSVKQGHSLTTMYKTYKKRSKHKLSKRQFLDICYDYNKMFSESLRNGSYEKITYLGDFFIKKIEVNYNKPRVDMNETKKAGKIIYHLNNHSDNFFFKFTWRKNKYGNKSDKNTVLYTFKSTFHNAKALAKKIKSDNGHKKFINHLK